MGGFELSAAVNTNNVFLINFAELQERLDPLFYNTVHGFSLVKYTTFPVKKLSEVINMQRGRFGHRPRNEPKFYGGQYPFIQTSDVVKASQTNAPITYTQTLNELGLQTSRLFDKNVMVITIAANIGDTAILDYPACFPDSLIGITPKTEALTLNYLNVYFKFLKPYLEDLAPQSAQKNINYQQLSPVPIVVPPLAIQKNITDLYRDAHQQKQQKEQQAQTLLDGIDSYLLNELGITLPQQDNRLEKRIFTVPFSEVTGERFDPDIYFTKNFKIEGGKYENSPLFKLAHVNKGQSITSNDIVAGKYPVIAGGQSSPYSHNVTNYQGNVITVSASGAYAGFVWYHDYPIFASDCSVIQSKNEKILNTLYLAELLKTKQKEIYNLQQGAGQPHVYSRDLILQNIPLPPIEKQSEIAAHIRQIRAQAKQLQADASRMLADAKAEIERMILGENG